MKRTLTSLFTTVLVAGFAVSASAATSVVLSSDAATYSPGSTITLTTTVTANGGETDSVVFGAVNYSDALLNPLVRTQVPLPPGDWSAGGLTCTVTFCVLFSQGHTLPALAIGWTNVAIATSTFQVDPGALIGTPITFLWRTTPSTQRLDWFGITNAPGVTVTVVPEPTTAVLLGLGLFGLAVAGRRRS